MRQWQNQMSANLALVSGAAGFFAPRFPAPWLHPPGTVEATSIYDTSGLKATLEQLIDFDRINASGMRFSIGAVNVRSGKFVYFDTTTHTIGPEHIMASGALPPASPPSRSKASIIGTAAWSRTRRCSGSSTAILFAILWRSRSICGMRAASCRAPLRRCRPAKRKSSIEPYPRRHRLFKYVQRLRRAMADLLEKLPEHCRHGPEAELLRPAGDHKVYNIVHLIYRARNYEGHSKDYEFSRASMQEHWRAGYHDAVRTLRHPEVLSAPQITKASSPSTSLVTAANKHETGRMLGALPFHD